MFGEEEFPSEDFDFAASDNESERKRKDHIKFEMWEEPGGERRASLEAPLNAFSYLMEPKAKKAKVEKDPEVWAVVYIRRLKFIDPSEPLHDVLYIGQSVRPGDSALKVAQMRWKEENGDAKRKDKELGLLAVLDMFGKGAFEDEVVESKFGPRSEVQKWADEREIALVAKYGGVLKSMSVKCQQTLNLTKGGKGHVSFEAMDAARTIAWVKFKRELEEYYECHETAYVAVDYVSASGYKLGAHAKGVRGSGELWKGHPDEQERRAWLESLKGWTWNNRESEEYLTACSERGKAQSEREEAADPGVHSRRAKAQTEREKAAGKQTIADRGKDWLANATPEQRAEAIRKQKETQNRPDFKAAASERTKAQIERENAAGKKTLADRAAEWRQNATPEQHAERIRKIKETHSTPDAIAAASERGKAQFEREKAAGKQTIADRGVEWLKNATPEQLTAASERAKAQIEREKAAGKQTIADRAAEWRQNATPEQHAERIRKMKETKSTPDVRAAASERGKAQFEREEAVDPGGRSRRGKAQAEREKAAGKKTLADRGTEWLQNETPEQRAERIRKLKETKSTPDAIAAASERSRAWVARETPEQKEERFAKMKATRDADREAKFALLSPQDRVKAEREHESRKRNNGRQRRKVDALKKRPELTGMTHVQLVKELTNYDFAPVDPGKPLGELVATLKQQQ